MRIVQSFWSCNNPDLLNTHAGWLAPEYNLMSWALSCLQLRQYYEEVVLYTDSISAKMLIDNMNLPYSEVVCNMDMLNKYHPHLWALPKIYTYTQQQQPFLHIDGDAYVWERFDDNLLQGNLVAQNLEISTNYYENIMQSLEAELNYFPQEIIEERKAKNRIYAYNAGIFGGSDLSFFRKYTQNALEFIEKNINVLSRINVANFNIFFEQHLFYCMIKKESKTVNVLLKEVIVDNGYQAFGSFTDVPHNKKYLHLLGGNKRNRIVCEHLADRLRQDYPEYYYKIISLFRNSHTPLIKDFYFYLNFSSEKDLVRRQKLLKQNYAANQLQKENSGELIVNENIFINISSIADDATRYFEKFKPNSSIMDYEQHLCDLNQFYQLLNNILKDKFSLLSKDYLYGRDLNVTSYYEYLFEDLQTIYTKTLIADDIVEILETKFDWSKLIESETNKIAKIIQQFEKKPSEIFTAIIPECNVKGLAASNMDQLDLLIFQTLKSPLSIRELLDILEDSFDAEELKDAKKEYESLIFERIENCIQYKIIRVLF